MVTHPSTNPVAQGQALNSQPVDYKYDTLTTIPKASKGPIYGPSLIPNNSRKLDGK